MSVPTHWTQRAPRPLRTAYDPDGQPHGTSLDRRWLWRLENTLAVNNTGTLTPLLADLRQYLDESCEHHWREFEGDDEFETFYQCLWCCLVRS